MNLIYSSSSHRGLLKFIPGIHHRGSICSSGDFNSYSIVMTNLEEQVLAMLYFSSFYFSIIKLKLEQLSSCKGRFATHPYTRSKYLYKGSQNSILERTNSDSFAPFIQVSFHCVVAKRIGIFFL